MSDQIKIPVSLYRGGTSKAAFFMEDDLPQNKEAKDKFLLRVMGKPDAKEVDGIGGGQLYSSKVAIISKSEVSDIDINYTFVQVEISTDSVDYSANCGNISSAVIPFAVDKKLVKFENNKVNHFTVYNTNSKRKLYMSCFVEDDEVKVIGDAVVDGIPGSGSEIILNYKDTACTFSDNLLPTGSPVDVIKMEDGSEVKISIVDFGILTGFVHFKDISENESSILTPEAQNSKNILAKTNEIRAKIAEKVGMVQNWKDYKISSYLPWLSVVQEPQDYIAGNNKKVSAESVSFLSRISVLGPWHPSCGGACSCAIAASAMIPDTVLNKIFNPKSNDEKIVIGHPLGSMTLNVKIEKKENSISFKEVSYMRTARKLFEGYAFIPKDYQQTI